MTENELEQQLRQAIALMEQLASASSEARADILNRLSTNAFAVRSTVVKEHLQNCQDVGHNSCGWQDVPGSSNIANEDAWIGPYRKSLIDAAREGIRDGSVVPAVPVPSITPGADLENFPFSRAR